MEAWSVDFQQSPDSDGVDALSEFVGINIVRKEDHLLLSTPAIIDKLRQMIGPRPPVCSSPMSEAHGCDLPISSDNPAYTGIDLRKPLGVCLFVGLAVRPDIVHECIVLAHYVGRGHLTMNVAAQVTRLGWYLLSTRDSHILCLRKSDDTLRFLLDASLANDAPTLKSYYGFIGTLGTNTGAVSWRSALARCVVSSTRDSELFACLHCTYRAFATRLFLSEIGLRQRAPTPLGSDAMAVIQGITVKTVHRDSRWSAIRFHVIKEAMEDLIIAAYHLPGTDNGSDMMTKILGPRLKHRHAMTSLGWGNSPQASETNSVSVTRRPHT